VKWFKRIALALVILLVVAQVIRPARTNPPIDPRKELQAPRPVMDIVQRSCNDCHSNRTVWPWYSQIAPVSWLLADDVNDGRKEVNFSEWTTLTPTRHARKLKEICEQVEKHEMPLKIYIPLHPAAKLSDADRKTLCDWAKAERARVIAAHPDAAQPQRRP
jgi:cytochrome c551/c552